MADGIEIERILPPLDRRRVGRSAWINDLTWPLAGGVGEVSPGR
jgi:hypothetical protein